MLRRYAEGIKPKRLRNALSKLWEFAYPHLAAISLILSVESVSKIAAFASRNCPRAARNVAPVCWRNKCANRERLRPARKAICPSVTVFWQLARRYSKALAILGSVVGFR